MIAKLGRSLPLVVLVSLLSSLGLRADRALGATPTEVDAAIQKAKAYLRSQQQADGNWPETPPEKQQFGGHTAIATYGLLAAGDKPQDEHVAKAIAWLEKADMKGTYAVGMRAQVWTYLPQGTRRAGLVARDAKILLGGADKFGRWGYTNDKKRGHNSTSQYGVIGLWACARLGFEVPTPFWQSCEDGWQECQSPNQGTWKYLSQAPAPGDEKATMTAAGLASLFITQEYLRANAGVVCKGNISDSHIEAALRWFGNNFDPDKSDGYLLYGIERVGVASGYKYFATHDWYAAGAEQLVRKQGKEGWWNSHGRIPGTAFGIFFLTRGRATVAMNKLQYEFEPAGKAGTTAAKSTADNEPHWNQRPRDAANISQWIGQSLERELNWQIVNLRAGSAADLLDAPILYVSGDQDLTRLAPEDRQKLKSFVEQGGLILGSADCGNAAFARSFRALGAELFPTYEFRPLAPTHLILRQPHNSAKWKNKVEVLGLSNGVRELMLLVPKQDLGRSWQQRTSQSRPEHFEFAANVFLYAVDKRNLRYKGETHVLTPDPAANPRRTVKLARIKYPGNWDPEPGGWRRMATHLLNDFGLTLNAETVELAGGGGGGGASGPSTAPAARPVRTTTTKASATNAPPPASPALRSLKGFDVAHLTGTSAFKLDAATTQEIRQFVQAGGTLIVDAAGGSTAFAQSAEKELATLFGAQSAQLAQPLPPSHAIYSLPAFKVEKVAYREFARERLGEALSAPRVSGITVNGRTAVLFSREDLSAGLVGHAVDGVAGYTPDSATQLMSNVILYATGEGNTMPAGAKSSVTKPAAKKHAVAK